MTDPAASPRDALALRLRTIVAPYGTVREVKMFGGVAFMVDERMAVAAGRDGGLLVRTDPAEYDSLLLRGGMPARMGGDRSMGRGWLTVPPPVIQDDAELAFWVQVGVDSRNASA